MVHFYHHQVFTFPNRHLTKPASVMPAVITVALPILPAPTVSATSAPADTLRVGDYLIGGGECQDLYGHPDIRY